VRRDGNCFFRAYGFAMHEWLLNTKDEVRKQTIVKNCQDSLKILVCARVLLLSLSLSLS
jgi:Peptidase C65 Otubain